MSYIPAELIKKKRNGLTHTNEEIHFLIESFTDQTLPEYQMSAWLMAVFFKGMTTEETSALTEAMLHSGRVLDFSHLPGLAIDKHSTGGVGDKTSLILAPIVAAAGVPVPMIAGRGLGHTGGTVDKLESIPGFNIDLTLDLFRKQVETLGFAIIGQTQEICPADKKIYSLRDVTATIESLPLICASIMSKKLAEGIGGLVLDVKHGSGAFMKTPAQAESLAGNLMDIGRTHGKKMATLITNMDQPLGRFIGNSLEMGECFAVLRNERFLHRSPSDFADTRELSLELAALMIWLGGKAMDPLDGLRKATEILDSGQAWEMFEKLCLAQGGDPKTLPIARNRIDILSTQSGYVTQVDCEAVGVAAILLGAGRMKITDVINPEVGIEVHSKLGDSVKIGEPLYTLYLNEPKEKALHAVAEVRKRLLAATNISLQKKPVPALITKRKVDH